VKRWAGGRASGKAGPWNGEGRSWVERKEIRKGGFGVWDKREREEGLGFFSLRSVLRLQILIFLFENFNTHQLKTMQQI
jgi:hypothetical protein